MSNSIHSFEQSFNTVFKDEIQQLEEQDKKVVTKAIGNISRCIVGYSKREGFGGKLAGFFYRVWNAVKAIFGQSDWQIGKRSIKDIDVIIFKAPKEILDNKELTSSLNSFIDTNNKFNEFYKKVETFGLRMLREMNLWEKILQSLKMNLHIKISMNFKN